MRVAVAARPLVARPTPARAWLALGGGLILLLGVIVAALALGSVEVPAEHTLRTVVHRLTGLGSLDGISPITQTIVADLRLPRVMAAVLVGAGLACAGTVFQALLRNPLADPYVIGTAAGASLGAIAGLMAPILLPALAIGAGSAWLGLGLVQLLAFAGGLGTVLVVLAIARTGGRIPPVTLLLTGYAVSAVLAAAVAMLMFVSGRALAAILSWLLGSLEAAGWSDLAFALPIMSLAAALLIIRWRKLNVLLLGDEPAANLGLEIEREKLVITVLATFMTSAAVAIAGTIGFVGLVVPHLLRLAIGPDHRLLLPASLVYGAALLTLADLGARLAGGIPVGVVTALIGAPFFVWLLRRSRAVGSLAVR